MEILFTKTVNKFNTIGINEKADYVTHISDSNL